MGAQVLASEAVTCPALLLSCLAGLQLPLACLLLIINSVLLYAGYSLRVCSARTRTVVPGRAPHPHQLACCGGGGLLWCSSILHLVGQRNRNTGRDSHSLSGRRSPQTRLLQPQCSAAQHSTAAGAAQSAVLGSVAFAAQHRVVCAPTRTCNRRRSHP